MVQVLGGEDAAKAYKPVMARFPDFAIDVGRTGAQQMRELDEVDSD